MPERPKWSPNTPDNDDGVDSQRPKESSAPQAPAFAPRSDVAKTPSKAPTSLPDAPAPGPSSPKNTPSKGASPKDTTPKTPESSEAPARPLRPRPEGTLASPSARRPKSLGPKGSEPSSLTGSMDDNMRQLASEARSGVASGDKETRKASRRKAAGRVTVLAARQGASAWTGGASEKALRTIDKVDPGLHKTKTIVTVAAIGIPAFVVILILGLLMAIIGVGPFANPTPASAACSQAALASTATPTVTPGTPPPPAQLSLFMAAERYAESRNNYADASSNATWDPNYTGGTLNGSGAFGAYQYIQSTWYSYAASAGVATYATDNPATLSPSIATTVQDKVATWEYTRDYKQDESNPVDTGNTWMWVAEQHFDSTYALPADQNVAPGNNGGETMAEYGNLVVGYMTSEPWLTTGSTTTTNAVLAAYSGTCNATEISGPLASQIVQIATAELGQTQAEGDATYGASAWGPLGEEWCSDFASWVYDQAGVTPAPGRLPYVGDIWDWGKSSGGTQLPPSATPAPGDLIIFGTGYANHGMAHVAIVTSVLPNGEITIIGGNSSIGANGQSTVSASTPFDPTSITAANYKAGGWPDPVYGYVQPPGA